MTFKLIETLGLMYTAWAVLVTHFLFVIVLIRGLYFDYILRYLGLVCYVKKARRGISSLLKTSDNIRI